MLTKKLSLAAALAVSVSSSLTLNAGESYDEYKYLSIPVSKLRDGYKKGEITLESGEKFQVKGFINPGFLNPCLISWVDENLAGRPIDSNSYSFVKDFGDREIDPRTGQPDLSQPMDRLRLMDLRLTKI